MSGLRQTGAAASPQPASEDVALRRGTGSRAGDGGRLRACFERFESLGLEPGRLAGPRSSVPCGLPMRVPVRRMLRSPAALAAFSRSVGSVLGDRVPLTLSLTDLGSEDISIRNLQKFCEYLRKLMPDRAALRLLGLSLASHQMPLQAFVVVSSALLGDGPRYVVFDTLQMKHHDNVRVTEEAERNWKYLWRNRAAAALLPVYGASVRSACPLLGEEAAGAVLPGFAMPVPVESAWLTLQLPLPRFADPLGRIDWQALDRSLVSAVTLAEEALPLMEWARLPQLRDARENRRLAVIPTGLGDLVLRRGVDPMSLGCLRWLNGLVLRMRGTLWERSHSIAKEHGPLPALSGIDPSLAFGDRSHRDDWHRRWRQALSDGAVRSRNILAISPYSVLPVDCSNAAAFTDLLPVIAHADTWSFGSPAAFEGWTYNEFKNFHRRAWAVMQGRNAAALVATGA